MIDDTLEHSARRIAERGREALLSRLRPAFEEAAREHGELLGLTPERLEEMIQRAADRADGLQWRRALASVATEELDISLGEALSHPAVERAQEIVGAPSYEESLAALGGRSASATPAPAPAPAAAPGPAPAPAAEEPEPEPERASTPPPVPQDEEDGFADEEDELVEEEEPVAAEGAAETLRLPAIHLGGIATLEPGEDGLELRLGGPGLDIARRQGRVLGRLRWPEIRALEVATPRGLRRRRRQGRAQLMVRTEHGDATFEIPDVTEDELRERLQPLMERYVPAA